MALPDTEQQTLRAIQRMEEHTGRTARWAAIIGWGILANAAFTAINVLATLAR